MIRKMNNDTDDDISNVIAGGALLETESIAYSLPESSDANNDNIGFESDSVYESGINFDSESSFKLLPIDKSVFIEPITLKTKRLKSPADNNSNKYNDINDDDSSVDPLSSSTKRSNKNAKKKYYVPNVQSLVNYGVQYVLEHFAYNAGEHFHITTRLMVTRLLERN